jgi:hypothetical protein
MKYLLTLSDYRVLGNDLYNVNGAKRIGFMIPRVFKFFQKKPARSTVKNKLPS